MLQSASVVVVVAVLVVVAAAAAAAVVWWWWWYVYVWSHLVSKKYTLDNLSSETLARFCDIFSTAADDGTKKVIGPSCSKGNIASIK